MLNTFQVLVQVELFTAYFITFWVHDCILFLKKHIWIYFIVVYFFKQTNMSMFYCYVLIHIWNNSVQCVLPVVFEEGRHWSLVHVDLDINIMRIIITTNMYQYDAFCTVHAFYVIRTIFLNIYFAIA